MAREHVRIEHEGRIVAIGDESISVEIEKKSSCAQCHAKSACSVAETSSSIVEVPVTIDPWAKSYEVGERVVVVMSSSMGIKAAILAYAVPLLLLLAAMSAASVAGLEQLYVGLTGIGAVAVYYLVLSFFRGKVARSFSFSLEKLH